MEDILIWIIVILVAAAIIAIPYIIFRTILHWIFDALGIKNRILNSVLALLLSIAFVYYFLFQMTLGCGLPQPSSSTELPKDEYKLHGLEGKIIVNLPDTLKIYSKERVTIRIAKSDIEEKIFVEHIKNYRREKAIVDRIKLSTVMTVNLKEVPKEDRIIIDRLNNNETQVIDTTKYSEWLFDIKPLDYGKINLVVSVSATIKTEFGNQKIDHLVYEKELEIFATAKDKVTVFWDKHYWVVLIGAICLFLLLYKLIPHQSIIQVHMANSNQTNFWNAGSLGLVIYIITIASIGVFKMLEISLYFVPLVFIGTILIYAIFTAVSLRDNDKLSEENFLKLMGIAIKKIPPLNWIFKDNTPSV